MSEPDHSGPESEEYHGGRWICSGCSEPWYMHGTPVACPYCGKGIGE